MKCKNCGAKFEKSLILCPFCGEENSEQANKEQQKSIEFYKHETNKLKQKPEEVVKKSRKWIAFAVVAVAVTIVMAVILGIFIERKDKDNSIAKQNKQLEVLEEYYDNGQYVEMSEYLMGIGKYYTDTFEKYYRTKTAYESKELDIDSIKDEGELIARYDAIKTESVAGFMNYIIMDMAELKQWQEEGFIYEEGDACLEFLEEYYKCLNENLGLTREDVDKALMNYDGTEESLYELAELVIKKVKGK